MIRCINNQNNINRLLTLKKRIFNLWEIGLEYNRRRFRKFRIEWPKDNNKYKGLNRNNSMSKRKRERLIILSPGWNLIKYSINNSVSTTKLTSTKSTKLSKPLLNHFFIKNKKSINFSQTFKTPKPNSKEFINHDKKNCKIIVKDFKIFMREKLF